MKIDFRFTDAKKGGYGTLGAGIYHALVEYGHIVTRDNPDVIFVYGVPDELNNVMQSYPDRKIPLIFYTVWESSKYPADWIELIRKHHVDLLLTATKFTQESLAKVGVDSKVWHHGIDNRWKYKPRKDDGVYTFIHYNAYEWRKGWEIVLMAFVEEFGVEEPVRLIMKARDRGESVWIMNGDKGLDLPNVQEIIGHISNEAMVELMDTVDCGVFPVKGEGWFLPVTELASCGVTSIFPNQMGLTEQWIDGAYVELELDGYIYAAPRYPGFMMMPSRVDLRKKMRWAVQHEQETRKMGLLASQEVQKRFNWEKIIKDLTNYLNSTILNYGHH